MDQYPTVWIVDDDPDDQMLMEMAIRQILPPIPVLYLDDGEDVLPSLQVAARLPKLILLDLNMPGKNGFDTLAELRNNPQYYQLPVVIFTTSLTAEDKQRCMALGANGYFTKPAQQDHIRQLIEHLVKQWNGY